MKCQYAALVPTASVCNPSKSRIGQYFNILSLNNKNRNESLGYFRVCGCLVVPLLQSLLWTALGSHISNSHSDVMQLVQSSYVLGCAGGVLECVGVCWGCVGAATLCWAQSKARFNDNDAGVAGRVKLLAKTPVGSLCDTEVACFACDRLAHSTSSFKCSSLQRRHLSLSPGYMRNNPTRQASVFCAWSAKLLGTGFLLRMGVWKVPKLHHRRLRVLDSQRQNHRF